MDLRSYEPGQITDQFVPLYRTLGKGLGGAAADGAGSAPGSETDGELDDPKSGSEVRAEVSSPLGVVVCSAKAVPAEKPALAATAANAKSASRRVLLLVSDEAFARTPSRSG